MEYFWKIIMKNGRAYLIKDKESDVKKFMEKVTKPNMFSDYKLVTESFEDVYRFNTVMINSNEISSVEYLIEVK